MRTSEDNDLVSFEVQGFLNSFAVFQVLREKSGDEIAKLLPGTLVGEVWRSDPCSQYSIYNLLKYHSLKYTELLYPENIFLSNDACFKLKIYNLNNNNLFLLKGEHFSFRMYVVFWKPNSIVYFLNIFLFSFICCTKSLEMLQCVQQHCVKLLFWNARICFHSLPSTLKVITFWNALGFMMICFYYKNSQFRQTDHIFF